MATYKEIHGTNIEVLSSDPSNPVNGQIWYNTTSNVVKGFLINAGSWSSAPNVATNRVYVGGCGSRTSALLFGGSDQATTTQSWNNTAWSSAPALNTGRRNMGSAGASNTSGLSVGGYTQAGPTTELANVESYNGSWTNQTALPSIRGKMGGAGTATLALMAGGEPTPNAQIVQTYNGSWTTNPSLNSGRKQIYGWGTSSSCVMAGGRNNDGPGSSNNTTEYYNGSSWTSGPTLLVAKYGAGMTQCGGTNNGSGYIAGGSNQALTPTNLNSTQTWDGTSWTAVGNLLTSLNGAGGGGSPSSGIIGGGTNDESGTANQAASTTFASGPSTVSFGN